MFAAVLFAVTMVALLYTYWKKVRHHPPGPWGLPVVGNFLQMDAAAPHHSLCRWARQFGGIYQVRLGAQPVVVVSDPELLESLLAKPEVTARPDTAASRLSLDFRGGLSRSDGETWGETRRLLMARLAALGSDEDGAPPLQDAVNEITTGLLDSFMLNNVGRHVQLGHEFNAAVINILWQAMTGEKYGAEDTDIMEAAHAIGHALAKYHVTVLADAFPFAEQLAVMLLPPGLASEVDELTERLVGPTVARHKQRMDPDAEPGDFVTAYLQEARKRPTVLNEIHLMHTVADVLLTGGEPTVATLEWALCFLCGRPDVQEKLQQEVDAVVGGRTPRLADLANMPFTAAFIMETQRRGDVVPLGMPHGVSRDITAAGYKIQRGAQITPLLSAAHHNPQLFPEPLTFRPERFLDATGRLLASQSLLPFLTGRRLCPGQQLASAQVFLTLAALMQRFTLSFPLGFVHDHNSRRDDPHVRRPKAFRFIPQLRADM